jgi:hypothetical protein
MLWRRPPFLNNIVVPCALYLPARDATLEELRAEMMKHLGILIEGGLIDLEALPVPDRGLANQPNS